MSSRFVLAIGVGAVLLGACTYRSMVDLAPFDARFSAAPVEPGSYCEVDRSGAQPVIKSGDKCAHVEWDAEHRVLIGWGDKADEADDKLNAALAPLGDGLALAQLEGGGESVHYVVLILTATGATAGVRVLGDDALSAVAARHRAVTFREGEARPGAHGRLEIVGGERSAMMGLMRDLAAVALRQAGDEGDPLPVMVKDAGAAADHPASADQIKAIARLDAIAAVLAARAPASSSAP